MLKYIGVFQKICVIAMNRMPKTREMLALIHKYLNSNSSKTEEKDLLNWVEKDETNKKIFIEQVKLWNYSNDDSNQFNTNRAFEILKRKITRLPVKNQNPFQIHKFLKYAAVFVLGLLSFLWFSHSGHIGSSPKVVGF